MPRLLRRPQFLGSVIRLNRKDSMSENHEHDPVVVEDATPEAGGGCPVPHGLTHPTMGDANQDWWPGRST